MGLTSRKELNVFFLYVPRYILLMETDLRGPFRQPDISESDRTGNGSCDACR